MLHLRAVRPDDMKFIWELANDPDVREVSFSSDPIPWEQHERWFKARLKDPACRFYVAESPPGERIGQVRFEKKDREWVISLSIVKDFRGRGIGVEMIKSASKSFFDETNEAEIIHAYIKNDNTASDRAFEKAGFRNAGSASINHPDDAVLMKLNKE